MTAIAAVETADGVELGCDSFFGDDWRDSMDRPKWFQRGEVVVAFSGSIRAVQVVEHHAKWRRRKATESDLAYLISSVVDSIRKVHEEHNIRPGDSNLIIIYRGAIYTLLEDYGLFRSKFGYASIGAADPWVMGALAATVGMNGRERVKLALDAAVKHCSSARPPFHYLFVPTKAARARKPKVEEA